MTDRQAAEAREPLTEDEYDAEWERLYAILGDGDRDAMLRFALEEKRALSVRLAQAEQERDKWKERAGYERGRLTMAEVRLREYEEALRREWWLNHGHPYAALYGDDGEMQCSECPCDFKRQPLDEVRAVVFAARACVAASGERSDTAEARVVKAPKEET